MGRFSTDTVGMTEGIGVAVLVGLTLLVTAIVGLNVLVIGEDDGGPQANFSYDYIAANDALIVTHEATSSSRGPTRGSPGPRWPVGSPRRPSGPATSCN